MELYLTVFKNLPLGWQITIALFMLIPYVLGGGSFALHLKNKKNKSHKGCPLYSDLLKREKIKEDIKNIKSKIFKEQIHVRDSKHINILFVMNNVFHKLSKKLDQTKHYEKLVQRIEYKVLNPMVETWLKENHLTKKPDWKAYKDHKIDLLLKTTIMELGDYYDERFFDVSPEDRYNANNKELIPVAIQEWNDMFDECREIARTYEEKIKALEKELDDNL